MIKCNVIICGTICRDASVRTGKDGKEFVSFPLQDSLPGKDGNGASLEISVSQEGGQAEAKGFKTGSRA